MITTNLTHTDISNVLSETTPQKGLEDQKDLEGAVDLEDQVVVAGLNTERIQHPLASR